MPHGDSFIVELKSKKKPIFFIRFDHFKVSDFLPLSYRNKISFDKLFLSLSVKNRFWFEIRGRVFTTQLEVGELINWKNQSSHWLIIGRWKSFKKVSFFKNIKKRFHKKKLKKNVLYQYCTSKQTFYCHLN